MHNSPRSQLCLDDSFWDTEDGIQIRCTDLCYFMSLGDLFVQALCAACLLNALSIHIKKGFRNDRGEPHTPTTRAYILNVLSGMCRLHRENQNSLLQCGVLREMHRCLEDDATSLVGLWATEALFYALMNNKSNQDAFKQWPHVHAVIIRSSKEKSLWSKHFSRNYVSAVVVRGARVGVGATRESGLRGPCNSTLSLRTQQAQLMLDLVYAPAAKDKDKDKEGGGAGPSPPSSVPSLVSQQSEASIASISGTEEAITFDTARGGAFKQGSRKDDR